MTPAEALKIEHRLKTERGQLRRGLADGALTLADALAHPAAAGMQAGRLLMALPWVGQVRAAETLRRARVPNPRVRVRELTVCQRAQLAASARRGA